MSRKLTASDRKTLIRMASSMEKGSTERKAILAGLEKTASSDALYDEWLKAYKTIRSLRHKEYEKVLRRVEKVFAKGGWKLDMSKSAIGQRNTGGRYGVGMDGLLVFSEQAGDAPRSTEETEDWLEAHIGVTYGLRMMGSGPHGPIWELPLEE